MQRRRPSRVRGVPSIGDVPRIARRRPQPRQGDGSFPRRYAGPDRPLDRRGGFPRDKRHRERLQNIPAEAARSPSGSKITPRPIPTTCAAGKTRGRTMTVARERLPNRRLAETFSLQCAGLSYVCTVGRFADGRPAEVFLSNHKNGSHADACARDSAIVASLALQHGVPLKTIVKALLRDGSGQPATPLGVALGHAGRSR